MNKYVDELPEEDVKSTHLRREGYWHGETRWNITGGTINSAITFILEDVGADRSTEVVRLSRRRLRQQEIHVIQGLEDNDSDTTSSRF